MTETGRGYSWAHGWVPLTMRAALQKTKGDREAAARLLGEARAERRRRRDARGGRVFVPPTPAHRAAAAERAAWSTLTDDQLAERMATAEEADVDRIVAELDRRDRRDRKTTAQRERRAAARQARDAAREARYDELLSAGTDPEDAYAEAFGIDRAKMQRDEAAAFLRSSGYAGKSFGELVRAAHRDHAALAWEHAEDECRGVLLNKAGQAAGIDPRSLFTGPETRARKYASRELLDHWQTAGRMTVDDFRASVIGGHMRSKGTGAWS